MKDFIYKHYTIMNAL